MSQSPASGNTDPAASQTATQAPPASSGPQNAQAPSANPDLHEQLAAAHRESAEWRGRAEQRAEEINKLTAGKPEKPKEAEAPKVEYATKDDLWKYENRRKLALAGDEFEKIQKEGISNPNMALELALARKGYSTPQAVTDALRQAESSSAPSVVDRSGSADNRTPAEKQAASRMGVTDADHAKYGERASRMITRVGV